MIWNYWLEKYKKNIVNSDGWRTFIKIDKIFERDIKNSLIQDYVPYLVDYPDWENINIVVDKNFSQTESLANVKLLVSIENNK